MSLNSDEVMVTLHKQERKKVLFLIVFIVHSKLSVIYVLNKNSLEFTVSLTFL